MTAIDNINRGGNMDKLNELKAQLEKLRRYNELTKKAFRRDGPKLGFDESTELDDLKLYFNFQHTAQAGLMLADAAVATLEQELKPKGFWARLWA